MHHLLLTGILLVHSALGADAASIALVGIHQEGFDATLQEEWIADASGVIRSEGRFEALDHELVARAMVGREQIILEEAFLATGRRLVEDGRVLYDQAQPAEAVPVLEEATEALRYGTQATNSVEDLWEADVTLGVAYLALGQADAATAAFSRAVTLLPARQLDAALYPPDQVEAYNALREARSALASTLDVTARLPRSLAEGDEVVTVYLNGTERGQAPATLEGVLPGENFVAARGPGGTFAFTVVDVPESGATSADLPMAEPTLGAKADSRFARVRQTSTLYKALARHAEADLVVLAGVVDGELRLQLYSAASDAFSTAISRPLQGDASQEATEALAEVLRFANSDGTLPEALSARSPEPLQVGTNALLARTLMDPMDPTTVEIVEVTKTPWLLIGGTGVIAAGAVTGAVLLATGGGGSEEEQYQGTIIVGPVD